MIFGQNIARGGIPLRAAIAKQISHDFDGISLFFDSVISKLGIVIIRVVE